ncbi:hypothetical protein [Haliscomenobacter sp.]|jgi:hypothetical protein|uniref:hypothetical protein n=1 Tax=Haliscomenobacter sp. TaxID=2717303 RepID=UPI003BAA43FF
MPKPLSIMSSFLMLVAFLPIAIYLYCYKFGFCKDIPDSLVVARVFLSGPLLITLGVLFLIFGRRKHEKIIGTIGLVVGLAWLILMFIELFSKP